MISHLLLVLFVGIALRSIERGAVVPLQKYNYQAMWFFLFLISITFIGWTNFEQWSGLPVLRVKLSSSAGWEDMNLPPSYVPRPKKVSCPSTVRGGKYYHSQTLQKQLQTLLRRPGASKGTAGSNFEGNKEKGVSNIWFFKMNKKARKNLVAGLALVGRPQCSSISSSTSDHPQNLLFEIILFVYTQS